MKTLYERRAAIFKALCEPKRQQIIELLQSGERCANELAEKLKMPQSSLSYHMKILCDSGIVKGREEGKWTYYHIDDSGLRSTDFEKMNVKELLSMNDIEKNIRRLILAGIGAAANSVEQVNAFFEGRECEAVDKLAAKGEEIVTKGKEANEELHRQVEKDFDDFCDRHRHSERKIDIASMSAEERAALLEQLQNFKEADESSNEE